MKVLFVNVVCGVASTGRICVNQAKELEKKGYECVIAYGRGTVSEDYEGTTWRIGDDKSVKRNAIIARLIDNEAFNARKATKAFLLQAERYNPDILWLHNIHGYYLNIEELFKWIKSRPQMAVKWTLHDCWAFTGHCTNFSSVSCEKWKNGCHRCPQRKEYPASWILDCSSRNYRRKKDVFCGMPNLTIYTPSEWLRKIVKKSFLQKYPIEVMENAIDHSAFVPTKSNMRERLKVDDKFMILGVANAWQRSKGLYVFYQLHGLLDSKRYQIVLVGLNKQQIKTMPTGIIGLQKTNSQHELAELYTAADVFVNPSTEETYGMTTLEASLCGTRAIVFEGTACAETALLHGGIVIPQSVEALFEEIIQLDTGSKGEK